MSNYITDQLEEVKTSEEYNTRIKIKGGEGGETKWLSITNTQLEAIKKALLVTKANKIKFSSLSKTIQAKIREELAADSKYSIIKDGTFKKFKDAYALTLEDARDNHVGNTYNRLDSLRNTIDDLQASLVVEMNRR